MLKQTLALLTKYQPAFAKYQQLIMCNIAALVAAYVSLNLLFSLPPDTKLGEKTLTLFNTIFSRSNSYWYISILSSLAVIYAIGAISIAKDQTKHAVFVKKSMSWSLTILAIALNSLFLPICVALITLLHAPIVNWSNVLSVGIICIGYFSLSVMVVYAKHIPSLR